MGKILSFTGLLWGQNKFQYTVSARNSNFYPQIKQLKKDTICFKGSKTKDDETYKEINNTADEYFARLKISIDAGLEFLKTKVRNLKVNKLALNNGAAGMARFTKSDQPPGYSYEMDINIETDSSFDATLHEGYHILQFDKDKEAPFVQTQQYIMSQLPEDSQVREQYQTLTKTIVYEVVLPIYSKHKHSVRESIIDCFRHGKYKEIEKINKEGLFSPQNTLLPVGLSRFFRDLPDEKYLKYLKSHAEIEVKAHQYCMNKNEEPIAIPNKEINMNKIRDIIAIKIYQEIIEMAEQEIQIRASKKTLKAA